MGTVDSINLSLLLTCITLSIIFFVAWQTMGRQKYALVWAVTFVIMGAQRFLNLIRDVIQPFELYWMIVVTLSVLTVAMGLVGHVLRVKANIPLRWIFYSLIPIIAVTFYYTVIDSHVGARTSLYVMYNSLLLVAAGVVVLRSRAVSFPAEIGASVTYFLLAGFQFTSAVFALMQGQVHDPVLWEAYKLLNFVIMPAAFSAMGMFVIFMLASDLSDEMKKLAVTDSMTGCLNRRGFYENAEQKAQELCKSGNQVCLVYLDVDHFKSLNDGYGHSAGDKALIEIVKTVETNTKHGDLFGRLGGEEFVLLLGRASLDEARGVAERLRARIEALVISYEKSQITVTSSFGVARVFDEALAIEYAIDRADKALYQAKQNGRNRVEFAE